MSNLDKGGGQVAGDLSINSLNIFKVWYFENSINGLFMGLGKREADRSRRWSACKRPHTPRWRGERVEEASRSTISIAGNGVRVFLVR